MTHHYIKKCRHCFKTIAQCRCGNQKEVRWDVCQAPACQAQEQAQVTAATRVDIGPAAVAPAAVELAQANAQLLLAAERERQLAELLKATEEKLAAAEARVAELAVGAWLGTYISVRRHK